MKKIKVITIGLLLVISMVGCGNKIVDRAIEQGNLFMSKKEYDKALASFQIAIDEGSKDESITKIVQIIETYNKSVTLFEQGNSEEAKNSIEEINQDYINYSIKDDIDNLKIEIEEKYSLTQEINEEFNQLEEFASAKNYDEAENIIKNLNEKELTEEQKNKILEFENKIQSGRNEQAKLETQTNKNKIISVLNKACQPLEALEKSISNGGTFSGHQGDFETIEKCGEELLELISKIEFSNLGGQDMYNDLKSHAMKMKDIYDYDVLELIGLNAELIYQIEENY